MSELLATKLRVPIPLPKQVRRSYLSARLEAGLEAGRRISLISAPAGFGKTTCIAEWIAGQGLPAAWLSLDPVDDEPLRFFSYLIGALKTIDKAIGSEIEGVLRAGQLPPIEVIITTLLNDISKHPNLFLLALDDFQVVQDGIILKFFEEILANSPSSSLHLVLLTREDPELPLARLRANNLLTEIRAADLRFNAQDTETFLNEVMNLELSEAEIMELEERTEGWIVGLQLASLALQSAAAGTGSHRPSEFIAGMRGSHRYFLNYLTEEIISRQPDAIRQFLLQTSILDRLSGGICDAVTGRSDSAEVLEKLLVANLFLVPLDEVRHWYRYHHLFGDLLRDLLAHSGQSNSLLHTRASRWYAQNGFITEAIHHALAGADYAAAVHWIEKHAMDMLMQWHVKTVEGWMRSIPAEWCAHSPRANLVFAWMHIIRGNFAQASPFLERLQILFADPHLMAGSDPSVEAGWLALQIILLNAQGKSAESLLLGSRALEIVPKDDIQTLSRIYLGLAGAYQQLDDYDRAVEAFEKLIHHARTANSSVAEMLGVSALALLLIQRGHLQPAYGWVSQAIDKIERAGVVPPITTALYGEMGSLNYYWFRLDEAHYYYRRAIQVSTLSGYRDAELYYSVILSELHQMAGDIQLANAEIRKAVELMRLESPVAVREEVISQQVHILLAQDDLLHAEAILQPHGFDFQSKFVYPEPPPGRIISISSREDITRPSGVLYLSALRILLYRYRSRGQREKQNLMAGIRLADVLISETLQRGYIPFGLEALLLRAQLYAALGDHPAMLREVAQAVKLAEPKGLISIFVAEGAQVFEALRTLHASNRLPDVRPDFIRAIFTGFSISRTSGLLPNTTTRTPASIEVEAGLEPLTEREIDVLQSMADGLTYAEIAERLFISVNTVRSHVKAVYGKLNVNNRTKAIEKAHRLQII